MEADIHNAFSARISARSAYERCRVETFAAFGTRYSANSARLGAVYDLSRESAVYAQYTNATLPVGSLFLLSASNAAFPMSRGKQAEVGFKQSLPEKRLDPLLNRCHGH